MSEEQQAWDHRPFRRWVNEQLDRLEWRQADLARALDVPPATVGRWMNGQRRPNTHYVDELAAVLGVDRDILLDLTGHRPLAEPAADDQMGRILSLLQRVDLSVHDRADFLESNLRRWLAFDQRVGAAVEGRPAALVALGGQLNDGRATRRDTGEDSAAPPGRND